MCLSDLPGPYPLPVPRAHALITDAQAIEDIYRTLLAAYGNWGPDTLSDISAIIAATGRSIVDVETITTDMIEDAVTGWPIARIQANQVTGYVRQSLDGGILVELHTRDPRAGRQLRVIVDGQLLHGPPPTQPADTTPPVGER
ncbi:hypothetical protein [Nonomuraea harbinensis]|uniref:Uncharacterized protein n=1 Tax=Nonomuraea harbinensis TaxID=1286938 RepID=A0ABW1BKA5_9ACTN|nr:hypothetical protein [Nonomuraea harbinensis]